MTLEEQLKADLAITGSTNTEQALLIVSGCDTWEKLHEYKKHIGRIDAMFKEYLKDSGLEDSNDNKKKAYALHRFLWRRSPVKNYTLARAGDSVRGILQIVPPYSLMPFNMLYAGSKYKEEEGLITGVIDNYLNGEERTGNCLGLTALYTALALRNNIDAGIIKRPGHILSCIEEKGKTILIENTNRWGFGEKLQKLGRWNKSSLNTLIASEAHTKRGIATKSMEQAYSDIIHFACPEYTEAGYNKESIWQRLLQTMSNAMRRKNKSWNTEGCTAAENYYSKGLWLANDYQLEKAIGEYSKAIELNEKHYLAFCERGVARFKLKQLNECIEDLTKTLEIDPENIRAAYYRARARHLTKDYEGAVEDYTTLIDCRVPMEPEDYTKRARAYRELGELEKSIDDFQAAEIAHKQIDAIYDLKSKYQ